MFRCLHAGDLDAVVCPELVADGGLSHYLLSVHEACSRPTAAVRFESEPAGAEVKTPSGQSCRTPCEPGSPLAQSPVTRNAEIDPPPRLR
jgi:hypothetical protein